MNWRDDAACKTMPTDLFFGKGKMAPEVDAACGACTVQADCLADALAFEVHEDFGKFYGVRGNMMPGKRYQLHLSRKRERATLAA